MQTNLHPDGSPREMDRHSGALFRVDADGASEWHSPFEFGISNTMAWSPDGGTFYFGDTLRDVIFAYDWDAEAGAVGERRVLIEKAGPGLPDGSCLDADGCLWNARFGGGCLVRITPDGRVDRTVELPLGQPTSCTFGGEGSGTLLLTSARFALSEAHLAAHPLEGAPLAVEVGVEGMPDRRFAG